MDGRVMVLAGGLSHERDVSIRSGRRIAEAMRGHGLDVEVRDVDASLLGTLMSDPPAVVIPLLHGAAGEDGSLRDVLDTLRLPYVGSGPDACRMAFDKAMAAVVVRAAGVHVPESVALPHTLFRELGAPSLLDALVERLGLPLVVKPTRGGSALGTAVVRAPEELPAAMVGAYAYGDTVLVQRFVAGTEVAVSVLDLSLDQAGSDPHAVVPAYALPAVEVVPDSGLYDYTARYTAGATEFFAPARLDPAVRSAVEQAAVAAHVALGLRDWSRSDLLIDADGTIWFLESNVAPGMTETSLLPQAVAAGGLDLGTLAAALTRRAVARAVSPAGR